MLAEQFVLQKIILRSVAAERFERHPENEKPAINTVAAPGQLRAGGVKRHHHPDAEPEQHGDDRDLAQQEDAIKALRALGDHVKTGYRN